MVIYIPKPGTCENPSHRIIHHDNASAIRKVAPTPAKPTHTTVNPAHTTVKPIVHTTIKPATHTLKAAAPVSSVTQILTPGAQPAPYVLVELPLVAALFDYVRNSGASEDDIQVVLTNLSKLGNTTTPLTADNLTDLTGILAMPVLDSNQTMLFRMNSRTVWSKFMWSLLNYSIALNSDIDGKEQAEAKIYSCADKISHMLKPYYSGDQVKAFDDALTKFGHLGVAVMQSLKAGTPLDGTKEQWDQNIDDIGTLLSTINPTEWPKDTVKSYLTYLVQFWVDSIRAREEKNWDKYQAAVDTMETLVITGNEHTPSLADVFSVGIINQFPYNFSV
jgi:hypothetical protein